VGACHGIEGGIIGEPLHLGLVERIRELAVRGDRGVVEDRDAHAAFGPCFGGEQPGMAMDPQAGPRAATGRRHDDLDQARHGATEVPERGGRRVPERGARAAGERRGHPAAVDAEDRMADRVHAGVDPV
jgi:hypothetical protein